MESFYYFLDYYLGYTHPVHVTQVEMPIGLVVGAFILALVAIKKTNAGISANHVILLAFLFIFPTVLGGVLDWWQYFGHKFIYPFRIKMILAGILFLLLLTAVILGWNRRSVSVAMLGIIFLAFVDVVALGYFGGEAVFGQRAPTAPAQFGAGETIYRYNCSGCHPYGGNHLAPKMTIVGSDKLASLTSFTNWIRDPKRPMPEFPPGQISDDQARQLRNYIDYFWEGHTEHGEGNKDHQTGGGDAGGKQTGPHPAGGNKGAGE